MRGADPAMLPPAQYLTPYMMSAVEIRDLDLGKYGEAWLEKNDPRRFPVSPALPPPSLRATEISC